jgi:Fic family protein
LLNEATNRLWLLEGIGRTLPNPLMLLGPLIRRESIFSSRIEGTYATPRQLLLFELHPVEPRDHNDPESDWEEVANYVEAFRYSLESQLPLSLRLIRDWHRILMDSVRGKDRTPGEFRRTQVGIGNPQNPRFVPPPPHEIGPCLDSFEKYINSTTSRLPPLIDCFLAHYQFETIHPFLDGNGRVGRLLLSTMLQIKSGLTKPWLHLSGYFERHRQQYVDRLLAVSAENDWEGWIRLCLQATVSQADETIKRCQNLQEAYRDFLEQLKGAKGSIRLAAIVDDLFSSPLVEPRALTRRLNVSYPTDQKDIDRLCEVGILEPVPGTEFKTYWSRRVFEIDYAGVEPSPTGTEDHRHSADSSAPPTAT